MNLHVAYGAVILALLTGIGVQYVHVLFAETVPLDGPRGERYQLKRSAGGDLVLQQGKSLPLASKRDYWGSMVISRVTWTDDQHLTIAMDDGTNLRVILGRIEA